MPGGRLSTGTGGELGGERRVARRAVLDDDGWLVDADDVAAAGTAERSRMRRLDLGHDGCARVAMHPGVGDRVHYLT